MALTTEAANHNLAVDAAIATWKLYVATLDLSTLEKSRIKFLWPTRTGSRSGAYPSDPVFSATPGVNSTYYHFVNVASSATQAPWFLEGVNIGGIPLFWKVSNNANAIT